MMNCVVCGKFITTKDGWITIHRVYPRKNNLMDYIEYLCSVGCYQTFIKTVVAGLK